MFLTSSWMTRVLPVPHAISITRAPLAQALRQSVWHGLKAGSLSSRNSTDSARLLRSLAGNIEVETQCELAPTQSKRINEERHPEGKPKHGSC